MRIDNYKVDLLLARQRKSMQALSVMTQGEQTNVLNDIFNKVDLKSVNALLANTGERFDELSGYIDNASGAAKNMADTQLDNLAGDVTLLKSAFEALQISLSDKLTPTIREGANFLIKLTEGAKEFVDSGGLERAADLFAKLAPLISATTAALVTYQAATKVASFIEILTKATEGQTIAQAALNVVMNANPFVLIATVIATVVAAVVSLTIANEDFRKAVIEIWDSIVSAISTAVDEIGEIIDGIKDKFGSVVSGIKDLLGIHSPSRVFAGIGENMALGLGEGWNDEFGQIKKNIEAGINFGTASMGLDFQTSTVDFDSSGLAQIGRSISNNMAFNMMPFLYNRAAEISQSTSRQSLTALFLLTKCTSTTSRSLSCKGLRHSKERNRGSFPNLLCHSIKSRSS